MFKFIKDHMETMDQAQIYPMISLLIFFLFFIVLLWYVKRMNKAELNDLSGIPLDKTDEQ